MSGHPQATNLSSPPSVAGPEKPPLCQSPSVYGRTTGKKSTFKSPQIIIKHTCCLERILTPAPTSGVQICPSKSVTPPDNLAVTLGRQYLANRGSTLTTLGTARCLCAYCLLRQVWSFLGPLPHPPILPRCLCPQPPHPLCRGILL